MRSLFIWLLATLALAESVMGQTTLKPPLPQLLQLAGVTAAEVVPDSSYLAASRTLNQQLPLYRTVMAKPLSAPYRIGMLTQSYAQSMNSPHELMGLTGAVAGIDVDRSEATALSALEVQLRATPDPLATSLAWMQPMLPPGSVWPPTLPDWVQLPNPLRFELSLVLATLGQSEKFLQRAMAKLPPDVTPEWLRRQALNGEIQLFEEPDFRLLWPLIEREALLAGMLDLIAATERLRRGVTHTARGPELAWKLDTPMGQIVVDTTGKDNHYHQETPLLLLDTAGNDTYDFLAPGKLASRVYPVHVLLDTQGNDRYTNNPPGADPSSATLGYGILWDAQGDDHYQGTQLAQGAALFGAALLLDDDGNNEFVAHSHSQGYALGGLAVLRSGAGNDQYTAQTHAQGSAGPAGVALLLDSAGNDHYTLNNTPLLLPSSQLPDRNASMGQGAGRGFLSSDTDGRSTAGGIGMLLDFAGNDTYIAQVFAQAVGYQEGLGVLVDDGGDDHFEAAWYAMGAAAHKGAGVFLKRGTGNDTYSASHSMSIGAAHDFSVGVFLDAGGDDTYAVQDLSLGVAHDNSVAWFTDASGEDRYQVSAKACHAFGSAQISDWGSRRESLANVGLFMDLGGQDSYPAHCQRARNNAHWPSPRQWPKLDLPSEAGAGMDGAFAMPFNVRAQTRSKATP